MKHLVNRFDQSYNILNKYFIRNISFHGIFFLKQLKFIFIKYIQLFKLMIQLFGNISKIYVQLGKNDQNYSAVNVFSPLIN